MSLVRNRFHRRAAAGLVAAAALTATALAATVMAAQPALAQPARPSDTSSTLTVVGTSDVFDSNLIQSVIKPDFEAANPGITLNYVSKGSGAAIAYAEQGAASALLVHAPSLENQFVDQGYSDNNAPGSAFFWGDYVVLGPNSDPVKVAQKDPHDAVGAFEAIAAAGKQGKANFVSRGGTPGTTVQEHQIWALTTGVTLCKVSDVNGGGYSPSTTTGDCPAAISYPSWYHATGLSQGPNITNADACNYPTGSPNNCYVLTDRGTFNYLQSTGAAQNLKIVTRDNSAKARGGIPLLVNTFHGYAVNPDKFSGSTAAGINEQAAQAFLAFVTGTYEQKRIGNYLNGSADAPFLPSAAPVITDPSNLTSSVTGNRSITISGTLTNVVPGTPALNDVPVTLVATDKFGVAHPLKASTTSGQGNYSFKFTPGYSASYSVTTDQITKVEYPDLDPPFRDLLAPSSNQIGNNTVYGKPIVKKATARNGVLTLTGTVAPAAVDGNATLTLYASSDGSAPSPVGQVTLDAGGTKYTERFALPSDTYSYYVQYADSSYIEPGNSRTATIEVP